MNSFPTQIIATIVALVIVLVIAWLCIKVLAQATKRTRSGYRIKVIESVPVGTKERVVLVSLDGEEMLLGVTGESVSVLSGNVAKISGEESVKNFLAKPGQ